MVIGQIFPIHRLGHEKGKGYKSFITRKTLAKRFMGDLKNRKISPEQYFVQNVEAAKTLYDPRAQTVYTEFSAEEALINQHISQILEYLNCRVPVFWGAGRKEAALVNASSNNIPLAIVIDIEKAYVKDMIDRIDLSKRSRVKSLIALFQSFSEDEQKKYLQQMLDGKPAFHACLGTTIGNFNQHELFMIFRDTMQVGDYLLLGFQLEKDPEKILQEYRDDRLIEDIVKLPFLAALEDKGVGLHSWKYNYDEHQVEYWFTFTADYESKDSALVFRSGDAIEVFRSKKYRVEQLRSELENHGLQYVMHVAKEDHCLLLLERV